MPTAMRLSGALDVEALERTFGEIIRRHEVLRTTFGVRGGRPFQVIAPAGEVKLCVEDLSELPEAEREAEAVRLALDESRRPFDLSEGPLVRVRLLRLSDEEHVALLTMHHIISDGWSMSVLVAEVGQLYAAYARGEASPLEELPIQYADFAVWQRERMSGEALERELAYWRAQLGGELPVLELPTDRPRPPVQSYKGAVAPFRLSEEVAAGLRAMSRERGCTLFMTLLAGFQALLHRYTGQTDIVVGSPVAGRNRAEVEPLIGFFVNTLALRADLSGGPSFGELMRRVREVSLGAYAHQEVPFERVVEALGVGRELSRSAVFQAAFTMQGEAAEAALSLPGLTLSRVATETVTAKFDLTLFVEDAGNHLRGYLEYNTELYEAATARRLSAHLASLLSAACPDPSRPLRSLPLLSAAERRRLVSELAGGPRSFPRSDPALRPHAAFERHAALTPGATALLCEGESLSYAELNARANRLARHLRALGVGPESRVALCLERGAGMVTSLLAVLKAGGAYVPLDPQYPRERLAFMLEDCGAGVLVADRSTLDSLPAHAARVLLLDELGGELSGHSPEDLGVEVGADNLAYVIYTSGSTGVPKGVGVTHANVWRLLAACAERVRFGPGDVWALFHSFAFDFSVWELWGGLASGGAVWVVPYWVSRQPEQFWRGLVGRRVTILSQTPSAFYQLMRAADEADAAEGGGPGDALRAVVFG
ncbi:MAG TPA: condensation domain-containing protein, partial [Solirubrobacterales bacterium]|nr:condensation domain-containing protein [Solirubrobacterales bacterium]